MIKRKCKQCGQVFRISDSEIKFFNEKNLHLPKRCSKCRKENKKHNNIDENNKDNNEPVRKTGKKKTFRNIIIALLIAIFPFIGKLYNIVNNDFNSAIKNEDSEISLTFRNNELWEDHYIKHGSEFGYNNKEEYLNGANKVINLTNVLHKKEADDGDDIYYDQNNNEIVFVSTDGYIRTYFKPTEGIEYYNRK